MCNGNWVGASPSSQPVSEIKLTVLEELTGKIAEWLFTNRHRMPNQRFYARWHDEIEASPLTEREYRNLANEIIALSQLPGIVAAAVKEAKRELLGRISAKKYFHFPEEVVNVKDIEVIRKEVENG